MNAKSRMLAIAFLAMLAGCVMPRTSGVWIEKGRLNIEDPAFAANIELVRDARERTAEGFLHAQVTLQNSNREDFDCQYCFEWLSENGMIQKHQASPWRPIVLHGREIKELDEVSILQGSADFRLKIRRCNPRSR